MKTKIGGTLTRRRALQLGGATVLAASMPMPHVWAQAGGVPLKFSLNLPRNGSNTPFIHALERGYFAAEGIKITAMDPGLGADALQRVATETYDASFTDLPLLAEFHAKNPEQTPLGVFNVFNVTPTCVVSWKSANIQKPADLVGKTLGGPVTDSGYRLFPVFFRTNKLDPASVKFNNMDLRLREAMFVKQEVDAITGFDSTIWFNLKSQGVKFEDISIMRYADYGLDLYSNSVIVSRKFLRDNAAAITPFLRAVAKGWRDALADHKAPAVAAVKVDPLVNGPLETERLEWVLKYQVSTAEVREFGLGAVQRARLARNIDTLVEGFQLTSKAPVDAIWSDRFLPPLADRRI
ncbi:MAG: ABC transporter substrate-binding protein [Proteobacteria bacterium]|nr:ABC transporter substrate-binding protein [Pseudomonadota bacterium]